MKKSVYSMVGRCAGISVSVALTTVVVVALRHAMETPQPLKSQLAGEARLYVWRRRSIFYKVLGNVDAPALVLLHTPDIGGSAYEMQSLMEPLAQTYRVYAPDLLGFGLSDRPGIEYSAAMYAELCQDFLRDVVKQPAVLVASELSCNYAISVAASMPELCSSLVLISPFALTGEPHQLLPLRERAEQPLIKALLYPLVSTRLAFFLAHRCHQSSQADLEQFYATTHQLGAEHAAMALFAGKLNENMAQQFEKLCQAVLLIWGTHTLEDQRMVSRLREVTQKRQARTVELIQGAGLSVHREKPESVIASIRRWQAEITPLFPAEPQTPGQTMEEASEVKKETETIAEYAPQVAIIQAYCFKCKKKTEMQDASEFTMKNGRLAVRGVCSVCGTSMTRIGGLK